MQAEMNLTLVVRSYLIVPVIVLPHPTRNCLRNSKRSFWTLLVLTKGDDGWTVDKIDADDDFMNVLSGDLLDTMDSLDSDE